MKKISLILFIATFFVGLFLLRVPLIQKLSPQVAKYYGFDISNIEVSQIGVDKIVVPMLTMQYVDRSVRADIEIHNLIVDINTYEAEVSAVSSSYVYVDVLNIDSADSASNKQSVNDIFDLLPIFGIGIEHLEINYRINDEDSVRFDGELSFSQNARLIGVLSSKDKFSLVVDLSLDGSDFVVNVLEENSDKEVIAFIGGYQIKDGWLDVMLNGGVSISRVNQLLSEYGPDVYVKNDISNIKAKFEVDLTRPTQRIMQSFAADLDIDSTLNVSVKHLGVKKAQIDVSVSCRIEKINLIDCSLKDPQRATIDFYKPPDWLAEYFNGLEGEYVIEINPSDQLTAQLSLKEILAAKAGGDASIVLRSRSSRVKINSLISDLSFNGVEQDWQLNAGYKLKVEALGVLEPVKVSRFVLEGKGKLTANEELVNIYVDKNSDVNALNVNYDGYAAKKVKFEQLSDARISYSYQDNKINADDLKFSLSPSQLRNTDVEIELTPIQIHVRNIEYSSIKQKLITKIDMDSILLRQRGIPVSAYGLSVRADLKDDQLSVDGKVELGEQKHTLSISASHDLLRGFGLGAVSGDAIELAGNEIISNQISDSGFPLQLKGGELDVDASAIWNINNSASEISVKLLAEQVMGDYAQNQFAGLNAALEFVGQDGWKLKQAANIKVGVVNVGVPLKDVSMRLDRMEYGVQEQPLIKLSNLSAAVLDGSIYSKKIEVDLNRRENMFSIFLSSLSLEKLIALNQTEDLTASGTLNGELPMRLDDGVLLVDGGWLRADDNGGYIKYDRIGEVLVGNENLQLVGELLEDFQYNEMSAQVDLVPGGGLTLATKLHGRSPNAALNKQVNLNFNIDFNLWKFLESARLLTRIDQDISEQILSNQK